MEHDQLNEVRTIALALPGVTERISHGEPCFFVGRRPLCYFHDNHRGDGRISLWCPAPLGAPDELVSSEPVRFFRPTPSASGVFAAWLGVHLDTSGADRVDWDEIAGIIEDAYRMVAPRALIAELDRLVTDQFRRTFEALERAFDERFQQLFGGGYARLTLTDPEDLTATGIEITARPPGKKAQNLAMLSGGERALTAVALLFAMLRVRPVPFCVLDEVDAALDEANIGRFTDALRELSSETQCIVITHNRGTIESADALYGVTVGDDSASRVISLRLDEATAIAGRSARAAAAALAEQTAVAEATAIAGATPLAATRAGVAGDG
jgi:hypothetical protein